MFEKLEGLSLELYFFGISLMFGIGSFLFKVRNEKLKRTKFNFVSELFFAGLAGYISFKLGLYLNMSFNMISIFVGIASFSGTRFLVKVEQLLNKYIDDKFDNKEDKDTKDKDDNSSN